MIAPENEADVSLLLAGVVSNASVESGLSCTASGYHSMEKTLVTGSLARAAISPEGETVCPGVTASRGERGVADPCHSQDGVRGPCLLSLPSVCEPPQK